MANDYFQDDGNPGYKGPLASGAIRTLFANIETGFDKLVGLTGNGSKIVAINSAGTAQEALSTTGSGNVVRATSPTLVTPALGTPASGVLDNCSLSSAKTTPIDADSVVIVDSAASNVLKKLTWANLKATVKAALEATGMTFTGPVLFDTVADIASVATIDLTDYGSGTIATVTGATATSAFTMSDGQTMTLVAAGAWPLTNTADTCEVLGGADYTCEADDVITFTKTGGVVRAFPHSLASRAQATADLRGVTKIISITRVGNGASGSVQYTGVGFAPKRVTFLTTQNSGTNSYTSEGAAGLDINGAINGGCKFSAADGGGSTSTLAIDARSTLAANYQRAGVASFDADGFTLNWILSGAGVSGTLSVQCICEG